MNPNLSRRQFGDEWVPRSGLYRQDPEYPTRGYRKAPDRLSAATKALGAGRSYDVAADVVRKGIKPSLN